MNQPNTELETVSDREFPLRQYNYWCNERHAHLLTHEGPLAHTIPGNAPAGPDCQFCADIERNIDHWSARLCEVQS